MLRWIIANCGSIFVTHLFRSPGLQEAIQNPSAVMIQSETVADEEVNALTVRDQQRGRLEPANVFLTLEDESGFAPIRFHVPGAGCSKT